MNRILIAVIGCLAFVLTGCSEKEELNVKSENNQAVTKGIEEQKSSEEESEVVVFNIAPSKADDIIATGAGAKMKEISKSSTEKLKLEDLDFMEEFPVEDQTTDEMFNRIVEWFAMDYADVHDPLVNFEPDYDEFSNEKREMKQLNISVLIDASGSMKAAIGGEQMMVLAKDAVNRFGAGLPEDAIVSLRVYGHEGTGSNADKAMSCASNELLYEPELYNEAEFNGAMEKFEAAGWTPLASAIKSGGEDIQIKASGKTQNMIFVVSDGIETCGGDPAAEAKALAASDLEIQVNVIGFNVDSNGQQQLKRVAKDGNGKYANVKSTIDFQNTFKTMLAEANAAVRELSRKVNQGNQINNRTMQMNDELLKLTSAFYEFATLENDNMYIVVNKLHQSNKIDNETQFELIDKINNRRKSLNEYGETLKQEKFKLIEQTRLGLFDSMD